MVKNKIAEQLANNEVTLDLAFNNLLLVASVINNKELLRWVEHEISGYQENDILPLYRKNEKSLQFVFSGLSGTYTINSAPMPVTYFSEEIWNEIANFKILEGVKIIERQLAIKDSEWSAVRDCTEYAGDVYANTGIQCFNISQILKKSHYEKVYNSIKVHLMKILLMIEKMYGSLDPAELETKKYDRLKLAEAGKLISTYITSLLDNKTGIPNPRISMPNKAPENKQNLGNAQQAASVEQQPQQVYQMQQPQQSPVMPQMAPQQMYQMQQPPVMPQMAPQQMYQMQPPIMPQITPQQMYQMQQPQQPPVIPSSQSMQQAPQALQDSAFNKNKISGQEQLNQEPEKKISVKPQEKEQATSVTAEKEKEAQVKEQEKSAASVTAEKEKEDSAKAAEIRKDRIPKSLLDYLEEKKSELIKKNE